MNSATVSRCVLASALVLVLLGGSMAFASTPLKFKAQGQGGVTDAGNQQYTLKGGHVTTFVLNGVPYDPSTLQLQYSLQAAVNGATVTGTATLDISSQGDKSHGDTQTSNLDVQVQTTLNGAIGIPVGNGQIPLYITGPSTISIDGNSPHQYNTVMQFESPWWNPFGGPLLIASQDGSFFLIATYSVGLINWNQVQDAGVIVGSLGNTPFSSPFAQLAQATEDMVTGLEVDSGTMTLTALPAPYNTATGQYHGISYIPKTTAVPNGPGCQLLGFPAGVCTDTGDVSAGFFSLSSSNPGLNNNIDIRGVYQTDWSVPSFYGFTTTVTGTGTPR